ncbi:MAG: hypothetical protein M1440_03620 [Gammaproteobacteria bacterium]|nr:hypothetical protein [Gammaproteobacteria bacterium]
MAMNDHTLLVEGEADRGFFEVLCRSLGLEARVEVAPPRRFGAGRDTKQAAFNILPMLLEDLVDREDGRLAVVVDADADNHAHGGGLYNALDAGLIDKEKPLYRALVDWLERIFPEPGLSD